MVSPALLDWLFVSAFEKKKKNHQKQAQSAASIESQSLKFQKGQLSNLVSGNTENWEESSMADGSPRTDISTDVDTDDKNQRVKLLLSPLLFVSIISFSWWVLFLLAYFSLDGTL